MEGVDNETSQSTNNIYEFREVSGSNKRPPAGTPPPVFKSRPTSFSLSSQQNIMMEDKKPIAPMQHLSKSTGNFLAAPDKSKIITNKNVCMDSGLKVKDSKRSYSTPSLRSNDSKESLREDDGRMVPGSKKAIRKNPRKFDRIPQTQV